MADGLPFKEGMRVATLRWYCPKCDEEKDFNVRSCERMILVRGEEFYLSGESLICPDCVEEVFHPDVDGRVQQAAYNLYRDRHRLLTPEGIRRLREKYGLSQRALARLLGWGLITIQRYESGALQDDAHDTVLRQMEDSGFVLDLLNRCEDRLSEREKRIVAKAATDEKTKKVASDLLRAAQEWAPTITLAMDVERGFRTFDLEKFGQMVLWFSNRQRNIFKTKMAKLLWLSDFAHFWRHRISISGLAYARAPRGPMPDSFHFFLGLLEAQGIIEVREEMSGLRIGDVIKAMESVRLEDFTLEESETLKRVDEKFGYFTASTLSRLSHQEKAWLTRADGELIPFTEADGVRLVAQVWESAAPF